MPFAPKTPPETAAGDGKHGCVTALAFVPVGIWALFAVLGIWINAGWKTQYRVDVTAGRRLPTDGGVPLALLVVIGVPCVVATIVAVMLNLGDRRSRPAVLGSYVFAAITAAGGAILLAVPAHITCRTVVGVTDLFPNYSPASCPSDYLNAANDAIRAINWASAGLVLIGVVAAIVTAWIDRTASGRKQ